MNKSSQYIIVICLIVIAVSSSLHTYSYMTCDFDENYAEEVKIENIEFKVIEQETLVVFDIVNYSDNIIDSMEYELALYDGDKYMFSLYESFYSTYLRQGQRKKASYKLDRDFDLSKYKIKPIVLEATN